MLNDLIKLRSILTQIETRGDSTKLMANCLFFVEEMIKNTSQEATTEENK